MKDILMPCSFFTESYNIRYAAAGLLTFPTSGSFPFAESEQWMSVGSTILFGRIGITAAGTVAESPSSVTGITAFPLSPFGTVARM